MRMCIANIDLWGYISNFNETSKHLNNSAFKIWHLLSKTMVDHKNGVAYEKN